MTETYETKELDLVAYLLCEGAEMLEYEKRDGGIYWFTLKLPDSKLPDAFYKGRAEANIMQFLNHRHNLYRLVKYQNH